MKSKSKITNEQIMRQLIHQVQKAANGSVEQMVITLITKPMWRAFLRGCGDSPNHKPTGWIGKRHLPCFWITHDCHRIQANDVGEF